MNKATKYNIIKAFGLGAYKGIYLGYLKIVPYSKSGGVETVYTDKPLGSDFGRTWFHAHQYNPFLLIDDYR